MVILMEIHSYQFIEHVFLTFHLIYRFFEFFYLLLYWLYAYQINASILLNQGGWTVEQYKLQIVIFFFWLIKSNNIYSIRQMILKKYTHLKIIVSYIIFYYNWQNPSTFKLIQLLSDHNVKEFNNLGKFFFNIEKIRNM